MLKEVISPRQWPDESVRRVFVDGYFDLFVWYAADGTISRCQLGYDKMGMPRVFEWLGGTLYHYRVDSGQEHSYTRVNMTAVLVPDPRGNPAEVAATLDAAGIQSQPAILEFVLAGLREHDEMQGDRYGNRNE
jgi:hypothetical protein